MTELATHSEKPPIDSKDAAWVTIKSVLPASQVKQLMSDVEAVFRLNPFYYFDAWDRQYDKTSIKLRNLSNNQAVEQSFVVDNAEEDLTISYEGGIKTRTIIRVEADNGGSRITLIDDYSGMSDAEREQHAEKADRSLQKWGEAIYTYLERIKKWSWIPGWRLYMRRIWIPMNPSGRRIVWILYIITLAEFAFILLLVGIWVLEQSGGTL